jgi:UDP-N-acetyl-D-galactosamine dehydrogenase
MGLTFKENCPDLRNTKIVNVIAELEDFGVDVDVYDPWVDPDEAKREYGLTPIAQPNAGTYSGILLAVAHDEFAAMGEGGLREYGTKDHVLFDLKYVLPIDQSDLRL